MIWLCPKDFERVLDDLDLYVYDNWIDGELVRPIENTGLHVSMWDRQRCPSWVVKDLDYDCRVSHKKILLLNPRKLELMIFQELKKEN